MGDFPKFNYYLGVECPHCHSHNTIGEVYAYTVEGRCLSCERSVPIPEVLKTLPPSGSLK